jgi:hypothetical protein
LTTFFSSLTSVSTFTRYLGSRGFDTAAARLALGMWNVKGKRSREEATERRKNRSLESIKLQKVRKIFIIKRAQ